MWDGAVRGCMGVTGATPQGSPLSAVIFMIASSQALDGTIATLRHLQPTAYVDDLRLENLHHMEPREESGIEELPEAGTRLAKGRRIWAAITPHPEISTLPKNMVNICKSQDDTWGMAQAQTFQNEGSTENYGGPGGGTRTEPPAYAPLTYVRALEHNAEAGRTIMFTDGSRMATKIPCANKGIPEWTETEDAAMVRIGWGLHIPGQSDRNQPEINKWGGTGTHSYEL
ncbi:hypothetical protein DFH27DRAFT_604556 [Peziza echinospora]|nr:hypothetical protein DFH27DRAFT_604556 [Peziza echinospora]